MAEPTMIMPGQEPDAGTPSSAHQAMAADWQMIDDILAGARAVRSAGIRYLPKYEDEENDEYARRLACAPWRPEFEDALRTLASKPFGKDVTLDDKAPSRIAGEIDPDTKTRKGGLVDDIDARGNSLTVFARETFAKGIAKGMHAILVDYPSMAAGLTVAAEKASGARPYWVQVAANDILALYTAMVDGKEVVTHVRLREDSTERDGFGERKVERVRVLEPGIWQLWEARTDAGGRKQWSKVEEGTFSRGGKTSVPLVLFFTGERRGPQQVKPPLLDLAHMQIELYRALSRQDEVLTFAGAPMLSANGFAPPAEGAKVAVGPKRVLFAPPGADGTATSWAFVQPDADNLEEIREQIGSITDDMRRLGMQPLTQKSGGVTATASSIEGAKAHSTVEAWALLLKDALEQAFVFTAEWLALADTVEVTVDTDFSVMPYAQAPLDALDKARGRKDISLRTYWNGLRRFDVLPPDFDADEEEVALADDMAGLEPEVEIDPVTGKPIQQDPAKPPVATP